MRIGWLQILCFCLFAPRLCASPGEVAILDFEGLRADTTDLPLVPSYTEDGYRFTSTDRDPHFGPDGLGFVGALHPNFYGSTAIIPALYNDAVMTRIDGRPFGLSTLKLVEHFDRNEADPSLMRTLTLNGLRANGVIVSQTFTIDEAVGFEEFSFSPEFTGLVEVTWNTDDPVTWWNHGVRVDDIVAFEVPEMATGLLLLAAVGLLAICDRCCRADRLTTALPSSKQSAWPAARSLAAAGRRSIGHLRESALPSD